MPKSTICRQYLLGVVLDVRDHRHEFKCVDPISLVERHDNSVLLAGPIFADSVGFVVLVLISWRNTEPLVDPLVNAS
jgi:hypothetical protein